MTLMAYNSVSPKPLSPWLCHDLNIGSTPQCWAFSLEHPPSTSTSTWLRNDTRCSLDFFLWNLLSCFTCSLSARCSNQNQSGAVPPHSSSLIQLTPTPKTLTTIPLSHLPPFLTWTDGVAGTLCAVDGLMLACSHPQGFPLGQAEVCESILSPHSTQPTRSCVPAAQKPPSLSKSLGWLQICVSIQFFWFYKVIWLWWSVFCVKSAGP